MTTTHLSSCLSCFLLQGHGRSPGLPALVNNFQDLVNDLSEFAKAQRERTRSGRVFLLGASMGGALSVLAGLGPLKDTVAGVVLLAPMLGIGQGLRRPAWMLWALSWAAYLLPWAAITPVPSVRANPKIIPHSKKKSTRAHLVSIFGLLDCLSVLGPRSEEWLTRIRQRLSDSMFVSSSLESPSKLSFFFSFFLPFVLPLSPLLLHSG
jgi:pimeloyl-ACP methyl ester carboxylesterase